MALRLEDFIDKKKEGPSILDLSKTKISSREEFDKAFDKVPDFKIKPEKIRSTDAKSHEGHFAFSAPRHEIISANQSSDFPFDNPIPPSMRAVRIEDLSAVDIHWRMLTLSRPKSKIEEDIFSRFVALDKMKRKTRSIEPDPPQKQIIQHKGKSKNKGASAVHETKFPTCKECSEELCGGLCKQFHYDPFVREILDEKEKEAEEKAAGLNLASLLEGVGGGKSGRSKQRSSRGGTGIGRPTTVRRVRRKKKSKAKADKSSDEEDDISARKPKSKTSRPKGDT
ncbi:unnamed protein product [Cyprideis torosa]|uniref:Uncharacterized protein n=1 Tax=Cyprideis torosa TaxID=163714 RepID=A0A7R8WEF5_9CRUS|nr:unnamed protein product [Cyprideis torosa]CAG0895634.1 unnamed protein product [Cyprideis torosa]